MVKKLKIYDTPISTYPHTADVASFLWGDEKIYPWLMNCFIKLFSWDLENMDYEDFWFLDCPAILCERLNRKIIAKRWGDYLTFIKDSIDMGYYIYLIVRTNEISAYGSTNYPHDLFIYGYDDMKEILNISDFFQGRKYSHTTTTYKEMDNALVYEEKEYSCHWIFHNDIILLKANHDSELLFQSSRVKSSITDYLYAAPTIYTYSRLKLNCTEEIKNYVFGMDCYKILRNHVKQNLLSGELQEHWRQVFHLMYEHKVVMIERIKFMMSINKLYNANIYLKAYSEIVNKALLMQNLYIKYAILLDKKILQKIEFIINDIEEKEYECLKSMLNDILA